jgi:hypothetical protein
MKTRKPVGSAAIPARAASLWLCALAMAMASASGALAQSLLPNGEFDTDIVGWSTAGAGSAVVWTTIDHSGCPPEVSGALLHVNFATSAGVQRGSAACVTDIVGNATYSFGAELHFPTGQGTTGEAEIVVVWFSTPDCTGLSGDTTAGGTTVDTSTAGSWVLVRNDSATAPADAISAAFSVRLTKNEAGDSLALAYDGAFLADGQVLLFNDGFERESSCHWSVTVP